MISDRKTAIIVGLLFLFGFTGIFTALFTKPLLNAEDYLILIYKNEEQWITGVFFQFIMAVSCAGIVYHIIKNDKYSVSYESLTCYLPSLIL